MSVDYQEFLRTKAIIHKASGFDIEDNDVAPIAKDHQRATVKYAIRKGKAAIFHDTGLGKTLDQLEIARIISDREDGPFLIVMPLNVAYETIHNINDETHILSTLNINVQVVREKTEISPGNGIYITNYENLYKFNDIKWVGVSFDESSLFKGEGKYFQTAKKMTKNIPYVFCASATPAPNSTEELGRQAEVLGIMTVEEMKATFFVNRQDKKIKADEGIEQGKKLNHIPFSEVSKNGKDDKLSRQGWQLRPHARDKFYQWLASWAMAIKKPSDLGFSDEGYDLPPLTITPIFIEAGYIPQDQLVFTGLGGVSDRAKVRKLTLEPKCQKAIELIGDSPDQWVVWCGLNSESDRMAELLGDKAVNVQGNDKLHVKVDNLRKFVNGDIQILVTKTKICGHGSNFQNCHKAIFVGLSDSWESLYQAIKRFHRFKQTEPVEIFIIMAEEEREIWENVQGKWDEAEYMTSQLIKNADQYQRKELDMKMNEKATYITDDVKTKDYHIMLGDSCERLKEIEDNSIGLSIYSPPFGNLFVYSNTERDLGNSLQEQAFFDHYRFIAADLLRVTTPGRKTVVHVADIHARKNKDGFLGLKDFSGDVIRLYDQCGWHYQGRIPIAKNPQATAIRLKAHELMFATMKRDASRLMPVQPDYLLVFTKPGKNPEPILPVENGEMNNDTWIEWAGNTWLDGKWDKLESDDLTEQDFIEIGKQIYDLYKSGNPIWQDIEETNVLQHKGRSGKRLDQNDTKHICPLQLEPVERAIKLWSKPGEKVLTPFMGIGTEVYQAVMFGRYGIGIELKPEYFYKAKENVEEAIRLSKQVDLFSLAGIEV